MTRRAILDAATRLFAERGPGGVSLRDVAEAAGRSQALVSRSFGSRSGLERAVVEVVAERLGAIVAELAEATGPAGGTWPFGPLLERLERDLVTEQILVRCALGELPDDPLVGPDNPARRLADLVGERITDRGPSDAPVGVAEFATLSGLTVLLGWLALDGFLSEAARLSGTTRALRARNVADGADFAAGLVVERAAELEFPKATRRPTRRASETGPVRGVDQVHDALVAATIAALGTPGPARLSTRDLAAAAKVNQGQIYHLFGSKQALLAESITASTDPFIAAAVRDGVLDLGAAAAVRLDSQAPVVIARLLANGVDIHSVRTTFPVFDSLLARYARVPTGACRAGLADPRIATMITGAFHQGSVIWEPLLRRMLDVRPGIDLDPAMAVVFRAIPDLAPTA